MTTSLHKDLLAAEVHQPFSYVYANAAARTGASGFTSADLGKWAWQQDNNSTWMLISVAPTWKELGATAIPSAHAASHENGGSDEIDVSGLSGTLADPQTPSSHASTHQHSGSDEVATATPGANAIPKAGGAGTLALGWIPAHASTHENGGADEMSVAGLSGALADPQTPSSHASTHEPGGGDAMTVDAAAATGSLRTLGTGAQQACAGNDSRLSDDRDPNAHASSHENGGGDEISVAGLSGLLADDQNPVNHASDHEPGGSDAMAVDAVAATGSLRTLGTGAQQACAGNDDRLNRITFTVQKGTPGTINVGQTVYLTGWDTGASVPEVELADASGTSTMPVFGIALESFTDTVSGKVLGIGLLNSIDTSSYSVGDTLYASETAGALTNTRPTGSALVQRLAKVLRVSPTDGKIRVCCATGFEIVPNLALNKVWLGDASAFPTETDRGGIDSDAIHDNVASEISVITEKTTPVGADLLLIEDSGATNAKKRVQIANLPSATPASHASSHENGGGDEISVAGLSGLLADPQTPSSHASTHEPGGGDAMTVDAAAATGSLRTIGTGALQACAGNDARLSDARTPTAHASTHEPGGGDAMAVDAAAATGSLRTIGTGALQACAGNDSRLSDARTPTAHASTHEPGGGDAMAVDAAAATGSLRTIGTGALQACAGNDSRLSDARTPTSHASTHEPGGGDAMAVDAAAATGSLRTIGTGALQACAGNDSRLSDARTPTAHNTTHQSGGSDAIKLDDLAAPDDNTDLDASTSKHGLLKKLGGGTTNFLRADGTWAAPPGTGGVFGSEYDYEEKTTEQSTTSTSFQQYMRLATASLPAGTYRIGWMIVYNGSNGTVDAKVRLQVDDTTELINPGDSGDENMVEEIIDGGSDQRSVRSGFRHVSLSAATHNIDLDFCCRASDGTIYMYHGQIELWRVS